MNTSGITKTTAANKNQILLNTQHFVTIGVVVTQTGSVTVDDKQLQLAGTPLAGNLDARTIAFTEALPDGTDVKGVLLHDVDVTNGASNGTLLIHGYVNTSRLETSVNTLLVTAIKTALEPKITFIAG